MYCIHLAKGEHKELHKRSRIYFLTKNYDETKYRCSLDMTEHKRYILFVMGILKKKPDVQLVHVLTCCAVIKSSH